jgi:hypothetical protein
MGTTRGCGVNKSEFLKLPMDERRRILAEQADAMVSHYEGMTDWADEKADELNRALLMRVGVPRAIIAAALRSARAEGMREGAVWALERFSTMYLDEFNDFLHGIKTGRVEVGK